MKPDIFFLPAFFVLGVVSTLEDFKTRRVSNLWIVLALIYAVIVHAYLLISAAPLERHWLFHSCVNVLLSLIVAVFFWKQHWWGGGDAKLFVCYAALIPLWRYPFGYFSYYFASFLLLIITFVPAAVWAFLHAQFSLTRAGKSLYENFRLARLREFVQFCLGFTALIFLWNLANLVVNQYIHWTRSSQMIIWLVGAMYYRSVSKLFQKRLWLVVMSWVVGMGIIIFVPFFSQTNVWFVLGNSFLSWLIIFILRKHVLRTVDYYVEWSKNNHMAFAGWMFLGALAIWFYKMIF